MGLSLIGFALIATGVVINEQDSRPQTTSVSHWGRAGGFAFLGTPSQENSYNRSAEEQFNTQQVAPAYTVIPISNSSLESGSQTGTLPKEWQSLLQQLVQPSTPSQTEKEPSGTDAYSFIPQGMMSVSDPVDQKTPFQTELFEYGNSVGSLIQTFDDGHRDMLPTLKDAYADRTNQSKRIAAERIGEDYIALGKEIEAISTVPSAVSSMHIALAKAYQDAGQKMIIKLRASSDKEFLAAIHSYNESVLTFTNMFVALATYFSAAGVKFSSIDPGSVFTFSPMQ